MCFTDVQLLPEHDRDKLKHAELTNCAKKKTLTLQ
jgi:hypothetical protein